MLRFKILNHKGFLLFEVMVTIVIITAGLLYVTHSYSTSNNSIKRSTEMLRASLLMETKMWGFEERGEIRVRLNETGDFSPEDEEYAWKLISQPISLTGLNHVTLEVFHSDPARTERTKYYIETYLKYKP